MVRSAMPARSPSAACVRPAARRCCLRSAPNDLLSVELPTSDLLVERRTARHRNRPAEPYQHWTASAVTHGTIHGFREPWFAPWSFVVGARPGPYARYQEAQRAAPVCGAGNWADATEGVCHGRGERVR